MNGADVVARTAAADRDARSPRLRRDREAGWLGGVSAGIAARVGVDPALVRLAFVVAAVAGGTGFVLYALAWLVIPAGAAEAAKRPRSPTGRAAVEVALGTGLLLLSVLLAFRAVGVWFSDALVWPLVLIASGGALIWRGSLGPPREQGAEAVAAASARPRAPGAAPDPTATTARAVAATPDPAASARRAAVAVSRNGVGAALVILAGVVFLQAAGALSAARDVLLAVIVVIVVLGVIFAPWIVRLVLSLASERAERIRSQERAEMAAHLHDSVLQTLALVQRRAARPTEVASLARRQERELRAWLAGRPAADGAARLATALEAAAAEVEERQGVPIEVVAVGDCELDGEAIAVVAAAREAMWNAAKFGEGSPVDVYAEVSAERMQVFVRDRGPGFEPSAVATDRRGVRDSIVGRMERHGGHATITSAPGTGTEVELLLERKAAAQ